MTMDQQTQRRLQDVGIVVFERGWLSSNNVILAAPGAEETVLIDTGYATHAEQTVALVRSALGDRRLDRIINTHLHSDHCGGNAALHQAFGCRIDVPAFEATTVDAWDERLLSFAATGQQCPRFRRTGVLSHGDKVVHGSMCWTALAAPGHDPSALVLYEPDHQLLISADALWENGFGVVFPELVGEPGFEAVEQTLEMLSALSVNWVIPGHGAPFTDVPAALRRARQRLGAMKASPEKHARHAAKVLLKFRLLEVQVIPKEALWSWMMLLPYTARIHETYFANTPLPKWFDEILEELCASGAALVRENLVMNG